MTTLIFLKDVFNFLVFEAIVWENFTTDATKTI